LAEKIAVLHKLKGLGWGEGRSAAAEEGLVFFPG